MFNSYIIYCNKLNIYALKKQSSNQQSIMKTINYLVVIALFTTSSFAQKKFKQGFRLGFGINTGYVLNKPFGFGLGLDSRLQFDLSKRYSLALTTGFTNFYVPEPGSDLGFIPVKLGFKAFIWNDKFYVLGEGGAAFSVTNSYKNNSAIIAPGLGFATKFIDLSVRYEYYPAFDKLNFDDTTSQGNGQLTLRLAYGFKL